MFLVLDCENRFSIWHGCNGKYMLHLLKLAAHHFDGAALLPVSSRTHGWLSFLFVPRRTSAAFLSHPMLLHAALCLSGCFLWSCCGIASPRCLLLFFFLPSVVSLCSFLSLGPQELPSASSGPVKESGCLGGGGRADFL